MSEDRAPISLVAEPPRNGHGAARRLRRSAGELEDAEDRIAVLEHDREVAKGDATPALTREEVERLLTGENRVKFWRQMIGVTQRDLAECTGVNQSLLTEIEKGTKTGSVETLKKIARQLKISVDALLD
jgi:DNA-binding XRE family transcriptional regulator